MIQYIGIRIWSRTDADSKYRAKGGNEKNFFAYFNKQKYKISFPMICYFELKINID